MGEQFSPASKIVDEELGVTVSLRSVLVRMLPARLTSPTLQRRTWTARRVSPTDDHLALYWNSTESPRRRALIKALTDELAGRPTPASVLEFGSHVGVNLRLLTDDPALRLDPVYAVETNAEAVDFLRAHLPAVTAMRGDHRDYLRARAFPPAPVTISFTNAVLYTLSPRAARRIVRKMVATSSVVVIGDNLDNAEGDRSQFLPEHRSFVHPFQTWLRQAGIHDIRRISFDEADYAISGLLIGVRKPSGEPRG